MTGSKLPPGDYPFWEGTIPLSEMTMVEAPRELEELLKKQAADTGVELIRDTPVELTCALPDGNNPKFLIYWPSGQDRIHLLVPNEQVKGRA